MATKRFVVHGSMFDHIASYDCPANSESEAIEKAIEALKNECSEEWYWKATEWNKLPQEYRAKRLWINGRKFVL